MLLRLPEDFEGRTDDYLSSSDQSLHFISRRLDLAAIVLRNNSIITNKGLFAEKSSFSGSPVRGQH